eukprot:scaffold988_cov165-Ochromonas_danica.AAC.52
MEVERTARVLDGSVVVIDGVAGVQAQTKSVWKCISKHALPSIFFINKMDRIGADWQAAVESIQKKLQGVAAVLPLQLPLDPSGSFDRVVDLLTWQLISWKPMEQKGTPGDIVCVPIEASDSFFELAQQKRRELFDALADVDEDFMGLCLEQQEQGEESYANIPVAEVIAALRRACLKREVSPVLFGSALRGKGIQPLLDAVAAFLPSPEESHRSLRLQHKDSHETVEVDSAKQPACALAFKVVHDANRGNMVYARLYSGSLQPKQPIYNSTAGVEERLHQILSIQADELDALPSAESGAVVCLIGLKNTKTGDTLQSIQSKHKQFVLQGLTIPPPVYSVSLEPESESKLKELEQALKWLCLEDPSLQVELENSESGQTIVRGLGELHLDILRDRLERQYKLAVHVGQRYIGYRESLSLLPDEVVHEEQVYELTSSEQKHFFARVQVSIQRRSADSEDCQVTLSPAVRSKLRPEEGQALLDALKNSFRHGRRGYPIVGLSLCVEEVEREEGQATTLGSLRACASLLMRRLMQENACHEVLEPVMAVEVNAPSSYLGDIVNDLTALRRGELQEVVESGTGTCVITALVPLESILGYATALRSQTRGEASFTAEYHSHKPVVG